VLAIQLSTFALGAGLSASAALGKLGAYLMASNCRIPFKDIVDLETFIDMGTGFLLACMTNKANVGVFEKRYLVSSIRSFFESWYELKGSSSLRAIGAEFFSSNANDFFSFNVPPSHPQYAQVQELLRHLMQDADAGVKYSESLPDADFKVIVGGMLCGEVLRTIFNSGLTAKQLRVKWQNFYDKCSQTQLAE
jgi:hypothetical protein